MNKKHWRTKHELGAAKAIIASSRARDDEKTHGSNDEIKSEEGDVRNDDCSFSRIPRHKGEGYRKIAISTENDTDAENNYNERKRGGGYMADYNHYDDDDDNMSRGTARSAMDLISQHRGISLKKSEKIMKAVAARVPVGEIGRRASSAASTINVNARRLSSAARSRFDGGGTTASPGKMDFDDTDLELMDSSTSRLWGMPTTKRMSKLYESSDLLDVPMVT